MATIAEEARRAASPGASPEERAKIGKEARAAVPRSSQRRLAAGVRPAGPGRGAREPGGDAGPRARPDPLRADARVAVRLLPRRGGDHGGRPRAHAEPGLQVQLCGDAHLVQLRRLRRARARAGLRHQRLRRDAARPVGVGRQATRGERRDRRPRPRLRRRASGAASCSRLRARIPRARCATFAGMRNLDVWYARLDVERARASGFERRADDEATARRSTGPSPRRERRTACGRSSKLDRRASTASCGSSASRR